VAKLAEGSLLQTITDIQKSYNLVVLFLYTCEAHAWDSWPLSPNAPENHTSIEERASTARAFLDKWPAFSSLLHGHYVDDMGDAATIANGLWPERFVLLRDGVATWASTLNDDVPGDISHDLRTAAQQAFA